MPGHPRLSCLIAVKTWMPGTSPGMTGFAVGFHSRISFLRLGERADQTGRLLDVALERLDRLVARQAGRKCGRLEIGRHQREGVVVLRAGRCAGPEIVRQL